MPRALMTVLLLLALIWNGSTLEGGWPGLVQAQRVLGAPCREQEERRIALQKEWSAKHRFEGTACYYSDSLDGRRTASGQIFRQALMTAAHRTLPLGTRVRVRSIATGLDVIVTVNDRGPFTGGFVIDLSRAAARAIRVDRAKDRRVTIELVDVPGLEENNLACGRELSEAE